MITIFPACYPPGTRVSFQDPNGLVEGVISECHLITNSIYYSICVNNQNEVFIKYLIKYSDVAIL
jgi:hypothetical protein